MELVIAAQKFPDVKKFLMTVAQHGLSKGVRKEASKMLKEWYVRDLQRVQVSNVAGQVKVS
jgi:hypothetical protein